jgi:carboxynorspermidine decarboxylase
MRPSQSAGSFDAGVAMNDGVHEIAAQNKSKLQTPYYLIDEQRLVDNLSKIKHLRDKSGAKAVLALKCFSTWSVFPLMSEYMDGTTSSSLYEARLGHEFFGGETHAYSVAFSESDVREARAFASKIIFNSISQLENLYLLAQGVPIGLRVNPGVSYSHYDLADPARRGSRLGVSDMAAIERVAGRISGLMFHVNCENGDFAALSKIVDHIGHQYGTLLHRMEWVSLGGGIAFTGPGYPLDALCERLKKFARDFGVQVYLEPGDAAVTMAGYLVTQVQDVLAHDCDIAIINAAVETHMLDNLVYHEDATIVLPAGVSSKERSCRYVIAGNTCLAGDVWGTYDFPDKLTVGDFVIFDNAARYTMVKMNWFNGVQMPSIVVRRLDGTIELVRKFGYDDFRTSLS